MRVAYVLYTGMPSRLARTDSTTVQAGNAYPRDCQVCYLCENDCPTHSISLSHDQQLETPHHL